MYTLLMIVCRVSGGDAMGPDGKGPLAYDQDGFSNTVLRFYCHQYLAASVNGEIGIFKSIKDDN